MIKLPVSNANMGGVIIIGWVVQVLVVLVVLVVNTQYYPDQHLNHDLNQHLNHDLNQHLNHDLNQHLNHQYQHEHL